MRRPRRWALRWRRQRVTVTALRHCRRSHGFLPSARRLVTVVRAVLADRVARTRALADCLVDLAAVSATRHRVRCRIRVLARRAVLAGASARPPRPLKQNGNFYGDNRMQTAVPFDLGGTTQTNWGGNVGY